VGFLERLDFRLEEPEGIEGSAGFADPGLLFSGLSISAAGFPFRLVLGADW
jgi:hypothetical protein